MFKKSIFILAIYLIFSFVALKVPVLAENSTTQILADTTISNYIERDWREPTLYLSKNNTKEDNILLKIPTLAYKEKQYLYLYSKQDANKVITLTVKYILEDFDISSPKLSFSSQKEIVTKEFLKGYNILALNKLHTIQEQIFGIYIQLESEIFLEFHASSIDQSSDCPPKFSPFLASSAELINLQENDQDQLPTTTISTQNKINKYFLYSENLKSLEDTGNKATLTSSNNSIDKLNIINIPNGICEIHDKTKIKQGVYSQCFFPSPRIFLIANKKSLTKYSIDVYVAFPKAMLVRYIAYNCKHSNLTFLRGNKNCVPKVETIMENSVRISYSNFLLVDNTSTIFTQLKKEKYSILNFWTDKDPSRKLVKVIAKYSLNYLNPFLPVSLNYESVQKVSNLAKIPDLTSKFSKPLAFVFDKPVGVTQWFGKTAYSKNHTGIDFAVRKNNILAPADGKILSYAWDNYKKCYSGGNILKIKHSDSLYTVYMHLAKNFNKVGSTVKKGANIALSGNSGLYKCGKIGYHLHLETRTTSKQKNAVNPVPLIDTDWSKIRTAGVSKYPGRLSGNNPHPTY